MNDTIRKNLLDLHYNKYTQYMTTAIAILVTYVIAVVVAAFTNQLDYENSAQMLILIVLSVSIISAVIITILRIKRHMIRIVNNIRRLGA